MDILIIGGQGFVGRNLVKLLIKDAKNNITVLSRGISIKPFFKDKIFKNVKFKGNTDIRNYKNLHPHFKNKDIVFNLAGLVSFKQRDKKALYEINYLGTLNVLKASEKYCVPKLIHLSSTAALGFGKKLLDESSLFDWSICPRCVYSISKYSPLEKLKNSKCNTIIVYPSLILGPGDTSNTSNLIKGIKNKSIFFNMPGSNSIIDVRDFVHALKIIMKSKEKNTSYIVKNGTYSFKKINEIIAEALDVKAPRVTLPNFSRYILLIIIRFVEWCIKNPPLTFENLYLSYKHRRHNADKIKKLGFKIKYSLKQTIKDAIKEMNL